MHYADLGQRRAQLWARELAEVAGELAASIAAGRPTVKRSTRVG